MQFSVHASHAQNCPLDDGFIRISYGLLRASHSRNPTGIRVFAVFHTASRSYLLPSKSHPVSYTRFARDDPVCVFTMCIKPAAPLLRNSRSCHMYSHSRVASHRSMLIHVSVDQACSFLCMLRMPKTARLTTALYNNISTFFGRGNQNVS